jgi:hypothetical protein
VEGLQGRQVSGLHLGTAVPERDTSCGESVMGYELIPMFWNFLVILNWTFWICLVVFIVTRKKWSWMIRGSILGAIVALFIFGVFIPMHEDTVAKDERRAYRQAAYDYFHKKCAEDSGRFVYKPVLEPQDSVYMMKPRKAATSEELQDQFWMGDPYGASIGDMVGLYELLQGSTLGKKNLSKIPAFNFIETHDFENQNKLWRYSLKPTGRMLPGRSSDDPKIIEVKPSRDSIESIQSRYGYTWDDLSTQEDRHFWVAKSRLQIIDMENQEVIAERIGYVIEEGFGSTANFRDKPWVYTGVGDNQWKRNYCPARESSTDGLWILAVLHSLSFDR